MSVFSRKNLLLAFIMLVGAAAATAQETPSRSGTQETSSRKAKQAARKERVNKLIKQEEEGALIYQKHNIFGAKLYSDGWGGFFERGYMKTVNKATLFSLEIGERKHPKEDKNVKQDQQTGFIFGNPYVYGKQNSFYFLKLGYGQSYLIGGKGNRNGVAVSAIYGGGLSLGFLKPYYLNVRDTNAAVRWYGDGRKSDTYFLDATPNGILGKAGFFKGFNELKFKPGVHAKAALRFDWGRYNELVSAVDAGVNAEFYFSDMPIMVYNDPKKFFLNVFVAIEFGKRK